MINQKNPDGVGYEEVVQRKLELCSMLGKQASAVLLDPLYSAAQCLEQGALPGGKGLLVSIEESGYEGGKENRITRLLDDWGVEKIKRMGASAVKLLIYYRPDLKELSKKQLGTVEKVATDCQKSDIPFFLEPVSYPLGEEATNPTLFATRKSELVIETARQMTALPIDVLKAEFPADVKYEKDRKILVRNCRELNTASRVPWVLLSAGVGFETFLEQVEMACEAGASGYMGGRAIWQEVMSILDTNKRIEFLSTIAAKRVQALNAVVAEKGRPWHRDEKIIAGLSDSWYKTY